MTQGFQAKDCTLSDLLSKGVALKMPPYQRSYSWEKREALDLFNDLINASENDEPHFIGAIVLVTDEDGRLLIVDGQQRLTTLTILCCVLRDIGIGEKHDEILRGLIADTYQEDALVRTEYRITLNHIDGPFFRQAIQNPGATKGKDITPSGSDSQMRMVENRDHFIEAVTGLQVAARKKLVETIAERLVLVRVTVADWDAGYNVFRVLNTRGKEPSNADLIKTYLLERANLTAAEAADISRKWSEYEARIGESGFDDLLNQIRVIYNRKSKKGPTEFRKHVLGWALTPKRIKYFVNEELKSYVEAYVTISKGQARLGDLSDEIKIPLNHLRLIDHQIWRAPALSFLVNNPDDPERTFKFFRQLERFAFAMMMVVTDTKARQRRYGRISDLSHNAQALLASNGPLALSRDEKRRMRDRLHGRFGSFAQRRAIALRLNAVIEGGRALGPDDGATVEHILPRNLPEKSVWHTSWPILSQHRELADTIGNFVLLPQDVNQKADSDSFMTKRNLYFANGGPEFALTADVEDQLTWTPEIVRTRTKRLATILSESWELV